ncbi:MAG: hypothetical protein AAFR36_32625, partial [Bacteroidota bacterium]
YKMVEKHFTSNLKLTNISQDKACFPAPFRPIFVVEMKKSCNLLAVVLVLNYSYHPDMHKRNLFCER